MPATVMPPPSIARILPNLQLENGVRTASPTSSKGYHPSPPSSGAKLTASPLYNAQALPSMAQRQASSASHDEASSASQAQQPGTTIRRPRPDTEEIRKVGKVHYQELLAFLKTHLAKEQTGPRSNAREKLTRLSKQQFTELSTDVYDELMRRINNAKQQIATPHLAVREEFHPKRNQARQKLATLPKTRFKDLSSDVFFELERRFPELKEHFRPEAIAREKAMELEEEEQRQREALAQRREQERAEEERHGRELTDRREAQEAEARRHNNLAAKESTSGIVVPIKSTLVDEEDISVPYRTGGDHGSDDDDPRHQQRGSAEMMDNRSTMYSQASSMGNGFIAGYAGGRGTGDFGYGRNSTTADGPNSFGIEKLRSDYEFKIATLQQKIATLEAQNVEMKEHSSRGQKYEEQLRLAESERDQLHAAHINEMGHLDAELDLHRQKHEEKHRELQAALERMDLLQKDVDARSASFSVTAEDMERLQGDLADQDQLISDLRSEIESLIQEIQQLSSRNEELVAEKDQDLIVARDLNQQILSFKRKYEQAKTELRQYKATSQLYVQPPKADEFMPPSDRGIIADVNVTAFQSSIDELLATARSTSPSNVLVSMKSVVLATTLVTDDVAKFEVSPSFPLSADDADQLLSLKPKISTTLNNLMNACRNHASSQGLSPVSLLDAAASHVAMTIVDLVKLLKLRSATKSEKEQFEAHFSGNALPPGGLKPLHMGSSIASRCQPLSPILPSDTTDSKWKSSAERKPSIEAMPASAGLRLSPRGGRSAPSGRYSPVGYRPSYSKLDSPLGQEGISQHPVSPNCYNAFTSKVAPTLPRTNLESIKTSWSNKRSSNSSASLRGKGTDSFEGADGSGGVGQESLTGDESRREDIASSSADRSSTFSRALRASRMGSGSASTPPRHLSGGNSRTQDQSGAGDGHIDDGDTSEENWAELRNYIEVQTEAIVHSIQSLLSAIREGAQGVQLNENLVQITTIASSIIAISRDNLPPSSKEEGEEILSELTDNCERLSEMQTRPSFDKSTKSAMASASYGVAKGLKALNGLLTEGEAIRQAEEMNALR